jgi:hypothetical protein
MMFNADPAAFSRYQMTKSRSGSPGSFLKVEDNDTLGSLVWTADDGVDYRTSAAEIQVQVDGVTAANSIPSRMVFYTNAGASSPIEAMRIDSSQNITVPNGNVTNISADATHGFYVENTATGAIGAMLMSVGSLNIGTTNNHDLSLITNNFTGIYIATDSTVSMVSLAGTGTRNVVVDANGKLSAP